MQTLDFSKAIQAVKAMKNILILPSSPADGDSIGSALALYTVLKGMGKNATVVLSTDVPDIYRFLPGADIIEKSVNVYSDFVVTVDLKGGQVKEVKHEVQDGKINIFITPEKSTISPDQVSYPTPEKKYDLLIMVDCANLIQLGEFYLQNYQIFSEVPSINFDHHETNGNFATVNLVDKSASSTTHILVDFFNELGAELTPDIATLLLAGIITDTGSFQNSNTTPEAFDVAAALIDKGARQQEIIKHIYKTKALETLKLWGKILSKISVDEANKIVWSTVTRQDFLDTGTDEANTGDIIDDLLSNAQEAEVVLLLEEKADGALHGSIRTTTDERDAAAIAAAFGGGGHKRAAGFNIPGASIASKEQEVLNAIIAEGKNRGATPLFESKNEQLPQVEAPITVDIPASPSPQHENTLPQPKDDKEIEKMAINFMSGQAPAAPSPKPDAPQSRPASGAPSGGELTGTAEDPAVNPPM